MANSVCATLVDLLRGRSDADQGRIAITFIDPVTASRHPLTRGEWDARSCSVATLLRQGNRVLVLLPAGPDFFVALTGALYAGACAVPVKPPADGAEVTHDVIDAALDAEAILLTPEHVVAEPACWLSEITRAKSPVFTGAPPCAYQDCVEMIPQRRRAEFDLSGWEVALIGSERISPRVLDCFTQAYQPYGFHGSAFFAPHGTTEIMMAMAHRGPAEPLRLTLGAVELESGTNWGRRGSRATLMISSVDSFQRYALPRLRSSSLPAPVYPAFRVARRSRTSHAFCYFAWALRKGARVRHAGTLTPTLTAPIAKPVCDVIRAEKRNLAQWSSSVILQVVLCAWFLETSKVRRSGSGYDGSEFDCSDDFLCSPPDQCAGVTVGLLVTARQNRVLKCIPGMMSNVLPLRLSVRPGMGLPELIGQTPLGLIDDLSIVVCGRKDSSGLQYRLAGVPGSL